MYICIYHTTDEQSCVNICDNNNNNNNNNNKLLNNLIVQKSVKKFSL